MNRPTTEIHNSYRQMIKCCSAPVKSAQQIFRTRAGSGEASPHQRRPPRISRAHRPSSVVDPPPIATVGPPSDHGSTITKASVDARSELHRSCTKGGPDPRFLVLYKKRDAADTDMGFCVAQYELASSGSPPAAIPDLELECRQNFRAQKLELI
ncbi:hypothetical protein B0H10DRAFT_2220577 [Mycena sp. CBHHK59/15]|nr:hypothetical protein B0H10DRAFT_2220577 [Mycena sp. CBHHK59/15]